MRAAQPQQRPRRLGRYVASLAGIGVLLLLGVSFLKGHDRATADPPQAATSALVPVAQRRARQPGAHSAARRAAKLVRFREEMKLVRSALEASVARAHRLGGRAQVSVWVDGWPVPVSVGDDLEKPMRMWSMAKPVEAIADVSRATKDHVRLTTGFEIAMQRALQRSENCSARRMVLELQKLSGGTRGARKAFASVLHEAGVHPIVATQEDGPSEQSADCEAFLRTYQDDLPTADGTAVLFGTSLWTVTDAVRFAHTLADDRYGPPGDVVLTTMAKAKELSEEPGATFTTDPRWGAGLAFAGYPLAYKAGWGGTRQGAFLAGQFAIITIRKRRVAVAAMFHPRTQPQIDDPGETQAPRAIQDIFAAVAHTFARLAAGAS